ncbi:hypothetical protein [Kolteria novifilia]|uniref:hypothetical protein n=1 Tax=Kolteria novifilia TaxID=2527975 RepID=UPI003AF3620F
MVASEATSDVFHQCLLGVHLAHESAEELAEFVALIASLAAPDQLHFTDNQRQMVI